MISTSLPVTLTSLPIKNGNINVIRDDLLAGGTKQRAAEIYIRLLKNTGFRENSLNPVFNSFNTISR